LRCRWRGGLPTKCRPLPRTVGGGVRVSAAFQVLQITAVKACSDGVRPTRVTGGCARRQTGGDRRRVERRNAERSVRGIGRRVHDDPPRPSLSPAASRKHTSTLSKFDCAPMLAVHRVVESGIADGLLRRLRRACIHSLVYDRGTRSQSQRPTSVATECRLRG
jgi:hypothetical protein